MLTVDCCDNVTVSFGNGDISSGGVTIQHSLYNEVSAGGAVSATMTFSLYDAINALLLQKGQKITFYVRLNDGETATAWVKRGVFFIESATANDDDSTSVVAYDEMSLLEGYKPSFIEDITISDYADLLNETYGCSLLVGSPLLDETVSMEGTSTMTAIGDISLPFDESGDINAREIVASIAALLGGNAYIDYTGELKTASPFSAGTGDTVNVTAGGISRDRKITRANSLIVYPSKTLTVPLYQDQRITDFDSFHDRAGIAVSVSINSIFAPKLGEQLRPFARNIGKKLFGQFDGYADYSGFLAHDAHVTPLFELLDTASVDIGSGKTESFVITNYRMTFGGECAGELSKPFVENSLQVNMQRIYYSTWYGWERHEWALSEYGYDSSYGQNYWRLKWAYESDRSFLACFFRQYYPTSSNVLYKIIGGQRIDFTFSYYYDTSGAIHHNVTVTGYSQEQILGSPHSTTVPFIRFYTEDAIDIDQSRPYSVGLVMVRSSVQEERYGVAFDMYYAKRISDN